MSYDEINNNVLDDIKKHEEKRQAAALRKLTSLAECDEGRQSMQLGPKQPKKAIRKGRSSKVNVDDVLLRQSSGSSSTDTPRPTLEVLERLTQVDMAEIQLEAFTLSTNKELNSCKEEENMKSCCIIT